MTEKASFANTYVTYRAFLLMCVAMITVGGTLFSFVLNMHASAPHHGAAHTTSVADVDSRVSRVESRVDSRLKRIESKVDELLTR